MRFSDFLLVSNPTDLNFIVGYTDDQNIRINVLDLFAGQIIGGGTTGYLPVFTSATSIDDSVIFQHGSNIVIGGIDSLGYKLAVNGSLYSSNGAVINSTVLGADALRVIGGDGDIFVIPNDLGQSISSLRRIIHPPAILTTESATLGQVNTAISDLEDDIDILLDLKVDKTSVGQPNGVASLDSGGKVPLSQIPDSIIGQVQYMGTWNAFTNTPTLNPLIPEERGHYYVVSAAGVFGGVDYAVGDWIISNGVIWEKVDNTDAVTSVFGRIGAILALEADYQSFYPRLSQAYDNPTWINSLAFTKITGVPPFLLENQTITLSGDVTGSGKTSISSTISNNAVSNEKLRDSVGTSVIGRAANSTGDPADIQASTDGHVLLRSAGNLLFGLISGDSISSIDWSKITGTPTTLSGYGITNAYTKTEADNKFVPYTGANANVNLGSNNITANSFIKAGGTSSQFLKADGSVDTSQYVPTTRSINAGTGLTGGGNLSSDITIAFDTTWGDNRYAYRTRQLTINGTTFDLSADRTWNVGTVTSVGLSMPSAFTVSNSPVTGSGTLTVVGAGTAAQYVRGDGSLGDFPGGGGGGGSSVSYYLNGSVNQGTFVGNTYYEMNKVPIFGAGTDFSINTNGYIAQFITDAGDPESLLIPAGNWNLEFYFSASSGGGSPTFYVELYKYDGTTFTLIASNSTNPELISLGTTVNPYFSSLGVPETVLAITDRLAIRIYVNNSGRTITLHTENSNLSQIITTFTTGITALNGLTKQVQYLTTGTSGTDFNISSSVATHVFNLPTASVTNRGALSSADWTTFNGKVGGTGASGQVAFWNGTSSQTGSNNLFWDNANGRLGINVLSTEEAIRVSGTGRIGNLLLRNTNTGDAGTGKVIWADGAGSGVLGLNSSTALTINTANVNRIYVQNNGNIGINTTTDAGFRLDVNGTARVQGVLTTTADAVVNGVNIGIGGGAVNTNTRVGQTALRDNTTGDGNTVIGFSALVANTTGSAGTAIGRNSMVSNTTGLSNTAVGNFSFSNNTTGNTNSAFGRNSGRFIADGTTALTSSENSVFLGADTRANANSQTNQIVIGHSAIGLGSNTTVIGNSSTTFGRWFGNLLVGSSTNSGQMLQVTGTSLLNGLSTIQGTTASDSGQLGAELLTTGTGDASWTGTSFATGYTHVAGSTTTLTSTLAGVVNTFYQIAYTVTGRTAGSFVIDFGGFTSSALTASNTIGPRATTTGTLVITPTSDFNGTIVLSIRTISGSSASVTFNNSAGTVTNQIRISSLDSNTFIGLNSGRNNTIGTNNSFYGRDCGVNNTTGGGNSFFGRGAGNVNTTGGSNSFFGFGSGTANITGGSNAFFGASSGAANTTGANNSFFGTIAGQNNTTGANNSFFGTSAGTANTTGGSNNFFGQASGGNNTTGSSNAFFGNASGFANTTASNNSFFGVASGQANTTGASNSFFGQNSGVANTTGASNSFFGQGSGQANTTGGTNISFGQNAGLNNTTGSNNCFIGFRAGRFIGAGTNLTIANNSIFIGVDSRAAADNQTNQIVIGNSAIGLGSNTTVLGNTSTTFGRWFGNLLVGNSTNSGQMLQVTGTAKITDTLTIGATDNSFIYESGGSLILQTGASADLVIPSSGASTFNFGLNVVGDLTLSNANPFLYGGNASGSLGLSNIGGQSYIRVFGASHATTPNITQFVNAGSTSLTLASTGAATFSGSVSTPHSTKTANYTLTETDYTVGFDCASNRTATLPDATTCAGRIYVIYQYNTGSGARSVTLDGNGSQTINGVTTYSLSPFCEYSSVMIQSNGANWIIISSNFTTDCL